MKRLPLANFLIVFLFLFSEDAHSWEWDVPYVAFDPASGTQQIYQNGQRWLPKGVNFFLMDYPFDMAHGYEDSDEEADIEPVKMALDKARALGVNTIRVFIPYKNEAWSSYPWVYEYETGEVNLNLLKHLMEIIHEAGERDMKVILTFFEGVASADGPGIHYDYWKGFDNYLSTIINAINEHPERLYRHILAWELKTEVDVSLYNDPSDHKSGYLWDSDQEKVMDWLWHLRTKIMELEKDKPSHLISVSCSKGSELLRADPRGRSIINSVADFVLLHYYDFSFTDSQSNYNKLCGIIDDIRLRTTKAIFLEEFGWPTGGGKEDYSEANQLKAFQDVINVANTKNLAGLCVWTLNDFDPDFWWFKTQQNLAFFGLLRFKPRFSLKPAGVAFKNDYP